MSGYDIYLENLSAYGGRCDDDGNDDSNDATGGCSGNVVVVVAVEKEICEQ